MPLPVNNSSLIQEMRRALHDLEEQIKHVKNDLAEDADGSYILVDLLVARANLLAAIANLQANR